MNRNDGSRSIRSRPIEVWLYLVAAFGLGVTALFGGGRLVLDPSGASLNIPIEWLTGTPFADYLIPGIILFSLLGVGSLVVIVAIVRRLRWTWPAAVGLGVVLIGWIAIQVVLLHVVNVLHVLYGGLGLLLVMLALLPSVRTELRE